MDAKLLDRLGQISQEEAYILEGRELDKNLYTNQHDFVVDSAKMLERGKLITIRPHTRFIDFPIHRHNYIEIMYICQGQITHVVEGTQEIALRQGELLFLGRRASHAIRKADREDIAVNFIVLPQFFDTAYDMLDHDNILSRFIAENLLGNSHEISYLHFRVSDVLPIQNLVENLVWSIINKQPNRRRINQTTMGLLFLLLLNHTNRAEFYEKPDYSNHLVLEVLREIEENYQYASLTDLAEKLNQPISQMSRLISSVTGKTYKELLQEKRLSRAAHLLETSSLSVTDIVQLVGYSNTSHFHRIFLRHYGMSPAAYRQFIARK